jgi:hypothetical protein
MVSEQAVSVGRRDDEDHTGGARTSGALTDTIAVLGVFVVLGVLCGLAWWLLVDPAMYTKVKGGGSMGELQLGKQFDSDGWYTLIAAVTGLVAGAVLTWWRSRDFLLTTVLVVIGAGLAAAAMALTGHLLGPGDPDAALAAAKVGQHVPMQLSVTGKVTYLVWPIAVLVGTLLVLWSPPRTARDDPAFDTPEPGKHVS